MKKMKKMFAAFAFVMAVFAFAFGIAPASAAEQMPEQTPAEQVGTIIGYAEVCQEFGLRLLNDPRIPALTRQLASANFHDQRQKIVSHFRSKDAPPPDVDDICPKVDEWLDYWAKVYGVPTGKR